MSRGKILISGAIIGAIIQGLRGRNVLEGAVLGAGAGAGLIATAEVMHQLKKMKAEQRLPKSIDALPEHDLEAVAEEITNQLNAKHRSTT